MRSSARKTSFRFLFLLFCLTCLFSGKTDAAAAAEEQPLKPSLTLPELPPSGPGYRTPRAGEGFHTEVLGRDVIVHPRQRRSTAAWYFSVALYEPGPEKSEISPIGVLDFWAHPDDERLFRAQVSGFYNEILWTRQLPRAAPFEAVVTFENFTVPLAQAELVDGKLIESEELVWGYVQPGFGMGYRRQVPPGMQENMAAIDLLIEPAFLYFNSGSKTASDFVIPRDTLVLRGHLQMRLDSLERNLLELPHQGTAAGADLVFGRRTHWQNWGTGGKELAGEGRSYETASGYFLWAGGIPGIASERHRMIGLVHAGWGHNVDRFSAVRVGGGPNPMGEEYGTSADPVFPGAVPHEFFPDHFLFVTGEYRWEAIFFAYLGINATVGRLDRLRSSEAGIVKRTDTLTAVGARLTSGFVFQTRLQVAYNYNFSVVREGRSGGHEIILNLARGF